MKKQHTLAVASLAAVTVLGAATFTGSASASSPSDPAPKQTVTTAKSSAKAVSVACNGGKVVNMKARTSADPFSFVGTSSADVLVPGTEILLKGPKRGKDTLLVTFSAETYYSGSGWMGLEVHLDGAPIQPFANNGSPFAINSAAKYVGASAQFCTKVSKGLHKLEVKANTTGGASDSGWIDDWTFSSIQFK